MKTNKRPIIKSCWECVKCEPKQKRLKMIGNAKVLKNALIE